MADATKTYASKLHNAHVMLGTISDLLDSHQDRQSRNPWDWGFPGDVGHVNELLAQVVEFLGGVPAAQ